MLFVDIFCSAAADCVSKAAKKTKKNRHYDTHRAGAQHDNQLTLKEANTEV